MRKPNQDVLSRELAEAIAQRRADLERTQSDVEREARLGAGFISRIERGVRKTLPRPREFARLCRALGFSQLEMLELAGYAPTWRALALAA